MRSQTACRNFPYVAIRIVVFRLVVFLGLIPALSAIAFAQTETEEPQPVTTPDAGATDLVSLADLKLLVSPLTAEELVVEADAWQGLLKGKMQEIVNARLNQGAGADDSGAGGTATDANTIVQLQEQKTQIADRLNVVVDELEAKGGDPEPYRQYVSALPGLAVDFFDAASIWATVQGWLVSEQGGQRWGWNIAKFLVILIVFYFAARIVSRFVRHAVSRIDKASQLLVAFSGRFTRQIVIIIGLMVSLAALEVNISPLLAAVGAAGFVIAFALQGTLSNFASGLLILAYRPFDVGDVIEAAGISGIVKSVTLFSTHVRTFDNKVMIVPNNDIWDGTITNATASDTRRVDMTFGIGYDDDITKAKQILESLLANHELVLSDPAPVVQLNELADSSVNFVCRPWTKTGDYWTVYWDITRSVKEEFDAASISIPYPQQDVHVHQHAAAEG